MLCSTRAVSAWSQTRSLTRFAPSLTPTGLSVRDQNHRDDHADHVECNQFSRATRIGDETGEREHGLRAAATHFRRNNPLRQEVRYDSHYGTSVASNKLRCRHSIFTHAHAIAGRGLLAGQVAERCTHVGRYVDGRKQHKLVARQSILHRVGRQNPYDPIVYPRGGGGLRTGGCR